MKMDYSCFMIGIQNYLLHQKSVSTKICLTSYRKYCSWRRLLVAQNITTAANIRNQNITFSLKLVVSSDNKKSRISFVLYYVVWKDFWLKKIVSLWYHVNRAVCACLLHIEAPRVWICDLLNSSTSHEIATRRVSLVNECTSHVFPIVQINCEAKEKFIRCEQREVCGE